MFIVYHRIMRFCEALVLVCEPALAFQVLLLPLDLTHCPRVQLQQLDVRVDECLYLRRTVLVGGW